LNKQSVSDWLIPSRDLSLNPNHRSPKYFIWFICFTKNKTFQKSFYAMRKWKTGGFEDCWCLAPGEKPLSYVSLLLNAKCYLPLIYHTLFTTNWEGPVQPIWSSSHLFLLLPILVYYWLLISYNDLCWNPDLCVLQARPGSGFHKTHHRT